MSLSPEQMRKKSIAEAESLKHARYAQADGSMRKENTFPPQSKAIDFEENRFRKSMNKEYKDIGGMDESSPNVDVRAGGMYNK